MEDKKEFNPGNETYFVNVGSPLLRPGLTVGIGGVSGRYLKKTMQYMLQVVRNFNVEQNQGLEKKTQQ